AWDLHVDGAQMVAAGEIEGLPVVAAKSEVGGRRRPVDDAAQLFAVWIHDPKPARSTAIDIALDIDLHAVRNPGLAAAQINKDTISLFREGAVGHQVECPDMSAARIIDVEHRFIGRKGEAVGQDKVADQQAYRAEIGGDTVHAGKGQVPLLGGGGTAPRIGEVDAAVGLDHDVVGPVELSPLKAVRDDGDAAVKLLPSDPTAVVLASDRPALEVAGQSVRPVRRFLEQRHAFARLVLHAPVVVDVAEQYIAAFP